MTEHGPDKALASAKAHGQVRTTGYVRAAVEEVGPAVRRYLFALGATWDQAEDLAQGALLKAWRARNSFDGRADVRTWIFSIARNHWRDELRKRETNRTEQSMTGHEQTIDPSAPEVDPPIKPRPPVALPDPPQAPPETPLEAAARNEFAHAVSMAMRTLPAEQREALALRESQGLSFRQIGQLLGVSPNTVKSRVRYALLKLANELKPFAPPSKSSLPPEYER